MISYLFDGSGVVVNVKNGLQTKAFTDIIITAILHDRLAGIRESKLGPCGKWRLYFFIFVFVCLSFPPRNKGKDISK
jgi:hypothetical protein